jgi:membrane fusion protein, multidrug efflux system
METTQNNVESAKDAPKIPSEPAPPKNGNGMKKRAGMVILLLVVGIIAGFVWWIRSTTHITTDNAFVEARIHTISPRVSGMVIRVMVKDNQYVRKGDLLLELDQNDYKVRVSTAAASLAVAKNETSGIYAQVEAAKAAVNSDRAKLKQAELDLARGEALYRKEVIPREQLDRLQTARSVAAARMAETEGNVRQALALLGLTGTGVKNAQIARKKAELDESRLNLSYTNIYAPSNGYITRKSVEPGNNVQAGQPLMALVDLDDSWITANYKESQLTHVKPGQQVKFAVDTYPGRTFSGSVESIMAGTGAAFSLLPPENATGNYVKVVQRIPVRIAIDKKSDPDRLLRVGMSVEPTIDTGRGFTDVIRNLNPFR